MKIYFLFILFLSQISSAAIECDWHKSFRKGFLGLKEVAEKSQLVARAINKVIKIEGIAGTQLRCSGSLVSKSGHILTASHCLDSCRSNWAADGENYFIPMGKRKNKTCQVMIGNRIYSAKVVSMNPCEMKLAIGSAVMQKEDGKTPFDFTEECQEANDIAIIQVDPEYLPAELCTEISWDRPALSSQVAAVGYPGKTERNNKNIGDSDGINAFGSFGRAIHKNQCDINYDKKNKENLSNSSLVWRDAIKDKMIQANVDTRWGSSGGPLIDQNGKIVGVTSATGRPDLGPDKTCAGSSFFASTQSIEKSLKLWNADIKKEDLTCR